MTEFRDLILYGVIAIMGGLAKIAHEYVADERMRPLIALARAFVSGFAGTILAVFAQSLGMAGNVLFVIAGVGGWVGNEAVNWIARRIEKELNGKGRK